MKTEEIMDFIEEIAKDHPWDKETFNELKKYIKQVPEVSYNDKRGQIKSEEIKEVLEICDSIIEFCSQKYVLPNHESGNYKIAKVCRDLLTKEHIRINQAEREAMERVFDGSIGICKSKCGAAIDHGESGDLALACAYAISKLRDEMLSTEMKK